MVLNFSEKLSDPSNEISAGKVLDGSFDPKQVAGKIVFIGATDPLSGDVRLAPTNKSSRLPGVFLHANAANTILTGTYIEPASDTTTLLWVALLTVIIGVLVLMLPLWLSPLITLLLAFGYVVVRRVAFRQRRHHQPRVPARRDGGRVPRRGRAPLLRRDEATSSGDRALLAIRSRDGRETPRRRGPRRRPQPKVNAST